jgi:RHS repeat-associated protein
VWRYVQNNNGTFNYVYQYKDHLGNVRLSYADTNNDGQITASSEIIEESNYYPFGLKHKGYNNVISSNGNSTAQKFGFGGKELSEELGLHTMDFSARNYDPTIGRWHVIDAMAEKAPDLTPFRYAFNNPINVIDPDGNFE